MLKSSQTGPPPGMPIRAGGGVRRAGNALGHDHHGGEERPLGGPSRAMHVRATANTGASAAEVREAMLHVAVYAGVPAANHALKIIKETYREMGVKP